MEWNGLSICFSVAETRIYNTPQSSSLCIWYSVGLEMYRDVKCLCYDP